MTDLYGADVRLRFDPAKLKVVDADPDTPGVQIGAGTFALAAEGFTVRNAADNETGEIEYTAALQGPAPPVSGDGVLATVTFRGISTGSSPITVDSVFLSDDQSNPIPTSTQDAAITIGLEPSSSCGDVNGYDVATFTVAPAP